MENGLFNSAALTCLFFLQEQDWSWTQYRAVKNPTKDSVLWVNDLYCKHVPCQSDTIWKLCDSILCHLHNNAVRQYVQQHVVVSYSCFNLNVYCWILKSTSSCNQDLFILIVILIRVNDDCWQTLHDGMWIHFINVWHIVIVFSLFKHFQCAFS